MLSFIKKIRRQKNKNNKGEAMRYLGNKTKLLNEIEGLLKEKNIYKDDLIFCDAFSGTASVSFHFKDKFKIIANDSLNLSYVITSAKLNSYEGMFETLGFDPFDYFNNLTKYQEDGFIYKTYAPTLGKRQYFSDENAKIIDTIRNTIDEWHAESLINENEKNYLIASLLESVSKVANIAGVYGAFLKKWDPRAVKKMVYFPIDTKPYVDRLASVYNENICELIERIDGDVLYLDPPYTSVQYSSQYHVLETIARNDSPEVKGITGMRDMSHVSSDFSKKVNVNVVFEQLIAKAKFKHIILSYSCDGLMSKEYIESVFKRYGKEDTYELKKIQYKRYKNSVAKDNDEHQEYLFYIEKKPQPEIKVCSPLNYQGGKWDLIDFIRDNLPAEYNTFYDLFGGGLNVGINMNCPKVVYNDVNFKVKELLESIIRADSKELLSYLQKTIKKFGLEANNKEAFVKLREKYNVNKLSSKDFRDLYLLAIYGFQQQIRFNSSYEFNNPVGLSYFNETMMEKLLSFKTAATKKNISFHSETYSHFEKFIKSGDFVYCDPPYLITLGSYNDGKRGFYGWTEKDEIEFLDFLERLNKKGIRFMLSNVITHKESVNTILKNWIERNGFTVVEFQGKARGGRKEIIVKNY